jgi:hypothetical protein
MKKNAPGAECLIFKRCKPGICHLFALSDHAKDAVGFFPGDIIICPGKGSAQFGPGYLVKEPLYSRAGRKAST